MWLSNVYMLTGVIFLVAVGRGFCAQGISCYKCDSPVSELARKCPPITEADDDAQLRRILTYKETCPDDVGTCLVGKEARGCGTPKTLCPASDQKKTCCSESLCNTWALPTVCYECKTNSTSKCPAIDNQNRDNLPAIETTEKSCNDGVTSCLVSNTGRLCGHANKSCNWSDSSCCEVPKCNYGPLPTATHRAARDVPIVKKRDTDAAASAKGIICYECTTRNASKCPAITAQNSGNLGTINTTETTCPSGVISCVITASGRKCGSTSPCSPAGKYCCDTPKCNVGKLAPVHGPTGALSHVIIHDEKPRGSGGSIHEPPDPGTKGRVHTQRASSLQAAFIVTLMSVVSALLLA